MSESVVDVRKVQHGSQSMLEVLIKWYNSPLVEDTWEEASDLDTIFRDFHLEDKVKFWTPGNVMKSMNEN